MPPGGGTPFNGLNGEAAHERGTFFRLQVHERVGILLVVVYERVGKSVIWVRERAQRAEQVNFMALQSRENVPFLRLILIKLQCIYSS